MPPARGVLYVVTCAAPPTQDLTEFLALVRRDGWAPFVIATPRAATWIDVPRITELTGRPPRFEHRRPDEKDTLPHADAVAVVPATFNTINKWAAGISDSVALGILNEALGLRLPIVVAPYAKPPLAAHPAFGGNLTLLRDWGVTVLPTDGIRPERPDGPFRWQPVLDALRAPVRPAPLAGSIEPGTGDRLPRPRTATDPERGRRARSAPPSRR